MKIKAVKKEYVQSMKWKPEPHTVALKDDGEWWGIFDDSENLMGVVCVSNKHNGKYFSETYTAPEYRNKGYCSMLISYLAKNIYPNDLLIAHCLKSSKHCFQLAGFKQYNFREFKHGNQYFMKREVKDGTTKT